MTGLVVFLAAVLIDTVRLAARRPLKADPAW